MRLQGNYPREAVELLGSIIYAITATSVGFTAICLVSSLGLLKEGEEPYWKIENREAIEHAERIVAGEDNIIDTLETRQALNALGYENSKLHDTRIQDEERIYFWETPDGHSKYQIGIGVGPSFEERRYVGTEYTDELVEKLK